MAKHVRRSRRRRRPKLPGSAVFTPARAAICGGALAAGLAIGLLLLTHGPEAYGGWREKRLLKRASAMLAQQDFDGAVRLARDIVQIRPDSLSAFYILAEASEKQNLPETVAWRSQIARVQKRDLDSQLNLASAALRFGQLDTARKALENVAQEERDRAAYHVVAGWLARAQGNDAEVEQHFAAAVEKEPGNDLYRFNLAVLRIPSDVPEKSDESRKVLEQLSKVPAFRAGSLRALLADAVQRNELERADTFAQDLQMSQQVTFADYLLCLEFYRKLDQSKFSTLLEKVKPVAARSRSDLGLLMEWLNENGLSAEVLKWMEKLPAELTTTPPPSVAIADAFVEGKNWSRLKRWTRGGSWGESEYLRLAYQAYGSKQSRQSAADAEFLSLWHSAERAAADRPDREIRLARLAAKWNFTAEAEQLWQLVSKDAPSRREALDALFRIYRANNDLRSLYRTAQRLHESSPNETSVAADCARFALLVDQNTAEGHRLAKETYDRAPTQVNAVVTYAFSLYGLGRSTEGVEIMKKLPAESLHDPHVAVYAAVLLLDENQIAAAQEYIAAAQAGPIFIEEKKLLEEALAKMSAATPTPSALATPAPIRKR
jgi:thioredoxin-like negative regulator of GroEL